MKRRIEARVICDSVSSAGDRLTTMEVTMPRIILAEFNTHRAFSRNSASSRAIPTRRLLRELAADPFVPTFSKACPGMASNDPVDAQWAARIVWLAMAFVCLAGVRVLHWLGVHKQHANRPLEWFAWHKVLVSATEWSNFFSQRISSGAQPEMRDTAVEMRFALGRSTPVERNYHYPYVSPLRGEDAGLISSGRCATASYDNLGTGVDMNRDLARAKDMAPKQHWSPFEHPAFAGDGTRNFRGWVQLRELMDGGPAGEETEGAR